MAKERVLGRRDMGNRILCTLCWSIPNKGTDPEIHPTSEQAEANEDVTSPDAWHRGIPCP